MSNELREAAERIRRLDAGEELGAIYSLDPMLEVAKDFSDLARGYLAEHPEDEDEPVTEEWLRSHDWHVYMDHPRRLQIETLPGLYLAWDLDDRVLLIHDLYVPDSTARGDVRRLCAAMGLELRGVSSKR